MALINDFNFISSLSKMLKMNDEFGTSAIVVLSTFNYYYEGRCRTYLMQALKSSWTVIISAVLKCGWFAGSD